MIELSPQAEEGIRLYKAGSADYRAGYDRGWDDAYHEMAGHDESCIPPLFRRFFWYPASDYGGDRIPWLDWSADEWCNPVLSVRMRRGVLHIRCGRRVRLSQDGRCKRCRSAEDTWRNDAH
jgi:hypothetical protein